MIRNIFGNNSKQTEKRRTMPFLTENTEDKNSFKKTMKSKFSFMRVDSFKIGSSRQKRRASPSPDRQGMFGKFTSTNTSNLNFENIDATFNLSSILKKSNSSRTSFKKSLRFVDDVIVEGFDASVMGNNQHHFDNVSLSNTFDTITLLDTSAMQMGETDEDYYKRMKEKLLSKNKRVAVSKPKRHKKSVKSENIITEEEFESLTPSIADYQYKNSEQEVVTSGQSSKVFGDIHNKFGSTTYLTPIASPLEKWTYTQSNLEISSNLENGLVSEVSQNLDSLPNNIMFNNLHQDQSNAETPLIMAVNDEYPAPPMFDSMFNDFSVSNSEILWDNSGFGENSNSSGKISSVKKSRGHRFDPIAKTETCGVSLLKDTRTDSNRMSWCSIASF